jgi:hypothetical protein
MPPHKTKNGDSPTFRQRMKGSQVREIMKAINIACLLSLAWLMAIVLPLALYQYFAISTPEILGDAAAYAWVIFFAPLLLLRWTPTFSSVDPLVSLLPSFAMLFLLWTTVIAVVVLFFRQLRRAAGLRNS